MEKAFLGWVARQDWLDRIADSVQDSVGKQMQNAGTGVTDVLHGTRLAHPLHPVLTDVPIGAWSATAVMDLVEMTTGSRTAAKFADGALFAGIASATATAVSGLADWRWVVGQPRRVGLVHAALNGASVLLNTASLLLRLQGKRRPAVALSTTAYGALLFSAWLGGELVYAEGIGVDHTAFQEGPRDFVPVVAEADLLDGHTRRVDAKGVPVLLLRRADQVFAIADTCSHQGGTLSRGDLEGDRITCPWHGSQFDLKHGAVIHGPSAFGQPVYETRIYEGQVEVRLAQP